MSRLIVSLSILIVMQSAFALEKLEKITNMNEFGYFTHMYYLQPQPELINSAITFIGSSDVVSNPNVKAPLLMSFSCLFSNYGSTEKEKWKSTIKTIAEPAKSLLTHSINNSPSKLLEETPTSPAKNDMNWACFFATGDFKYLNSIIEVLKYLDDRKDINLFLTAASAKWSLSSNAKSHFKVRMAMEAMKVGDVPDMRPLAEEILDKDPQVIREETVAVLKEQKEKGVWK